MKKKMQREGRVVGIEKFKLYAKPRQIYLLVETYDIYKVVHNKKISQREAVRAAMTNPDGSISVGWVINLAGRQRKFVADERGYKLFHIK